MAEDFAKTQMAPFAAKWDQEEALPGNHNSGWSPNLQMMFFVLLQSLVLVAFTFVRKLVGALSAGCKLQSFLKLCPQLVFPPPLICQFTSKEEESNSLTFSMAASMIDNYGTTEVREKYLPSLCTMDVGL